MPAIRTVALDVAPTEVVSRKFSVETGSSYEGEMLFFYLLVPKNGDRPYRESEFTLYEVNDDRPNRLLWHAEGHYWDGYVYPNEGLHILHPQYTQREIPVHRHWFKGRLRLEGNEVAKGTGRIEVIYLDYSGHDV